MNPSPSLQLEVFVHHKELEIVDTNSSTAVYAGRLHRSKPHIAISRVSKQGMGSQDVGQASFHKMSSDIDIQVNGQILDMHRKGPFSSAHEVNVAGLNWSWSKDGIFSNDVTLIDNNSGRAVAKFQREKWSRKKLGTMEIMGNQEPHMVDAIVLTGLAKYEFLRRRQRSGAAAAGASAGAGGGGGGC